jgi:hypothetical protein
VVTRHSVGRVSQPVKKRDVIDDDHRRSFAERSASTPRRRPVISYRALDPAADREPEETT